MFRYITKLQLLISFSIVLAACIQAFIIWEEHMKEAIFILGSGFFLFGCAVIAFVVRNLFNNDKVNY